MQKVKHTKKYIEMQRLDRLALEMTSFRQGLERI